jgi:peptidyl-prolyl cis-trans isomerase C
LDVADLVHAAGGETGGEAVRPVLRFAVLGALLFGVHAAWSGRRLEGSRVLKLTPGDVAQLRHAALGETGHLPDAVELRRRVDAVLADELLYREALRRGLAAEDPVVLRRLARNMRFLGSAGGDAGLVRQANALGMGESDVVVRRRLIERMRLAIEDEARLREPSEADLGAYVAAHRERYSEPARVAFTQVFVRSVDSNAEQRADDLLIRLCRAGAPQPDSKAGDAFLAPARQPLQSEHEIAKLFGGELAAALMKLPTAQWSGPLRSPYGWHLVWVQEKRAARPIALSRIRSQVRQEWLAERGERAVQRTVAELRRRYRVELPALE